MDGDPPAEDMVIEPEPPVIAEGFEDPDRDVDLIDVDIVDVGDLMAVPEASRVEEVTREPVRMVADRRGGRGAPATKSRSGASTPAGSGVPISMSEEPLPDAPDSSADAEASARAPSAPDESPEGRSQNHIAAAPNAKRIKAMVSNKPHALVGERMPMEARVTFVIVGLSPDGR